MAIYEMDCGCVVEVDDDDTSIGIHHQSCKHMQWLLKHQERSKYRSCGMWSKLIATHLNAHCLDEDDFDQCG